MDNIIENFDKYLQIASAVIAAFAVIATFTPNESDNKIVDFIYALINKLGLNIGNARNG
jgi:hypothetical protein